jgi:GntR family transcriptional regulator/MocR family aminotransferase
MVSGIQQALDLLSRLLLKQNDPVWMEDPGYFGATVAFGNAAAADRFPSCFLYLYFAT